MGFVVTKPGDKPSGSRAGLAKVARTFCLPGGCEKGDGIGTKIIGAITSPQCLVLLTFHVRLSRRGFEGIKALLVYGRGGGVSGAGGKHGGKSASSREQRICLL